MQRFHHEWRTSRASKQFRASRLSMLCIALVALGTRFESGWQTRFDDGNLRLETHEVPGSQFEDIRVTCTTTASAHALLAVLWSSVTDTSLSPEVVHRDVLADELHLRRYYEVIHVPPVSDRDYVMQETWAEDERSGVITLRFATVSDDRKPPTASPVRLTKVEGLGVARSLPDGGSTLTYRVFTDLGGSVPAWLAHAALRDAARDFVLEVRRRAEAR